MLAAIEIRAADFDRPGDCAGFLAVLDSYAAGATGGGKRLSPSVRERLVPALREQPSALVLLAASPQQVVGVATCFFGFSTFYARPLLNVHDLAVLPEFRRRGVGQALLVGAEERARARGCCRLTLEVLESNHAARELYQKRGFCDFELGGSSQRTLFLAKTLAASE